MEQLSYRQLITIIIEKIIICICNIIFNRSFITFRRYAVPLGNEGLQTGERSSQGEFPLQDLSHDGVFQSQRDVTMICKLDTFQQIAQPRGLGLFKFCRDQKANGGYPLQKRLLIANAEIYLFFRLARGFYAFVEISQGQGLGSPLQIKLVCKLRHPVCHCHTLLHSSEGGRSNLRGITPKVLVAAVFS